MNVNDTADKISVNARSAALMHRLRDDAAALRIHEFELDNGTRVIDAGIDVAGGLEAGRRIAEICMGGLGTVSLRSAPAGGSWPWYVDVHSSNPVIACLASQYAGWSLSHGKGKQAFNALGSGPARALGSKEPLFEELQYRDSYSEGCLVIETDTVPPGELADDIAGRCGVPAPSLNLVLTPTSSLAGMVQIISRVLETALHKAHALGFELRRIVDGSGTAPLCPPSPDFLTAMGRTNDAILFAGEVHLYVNADDRETASLAEQLPSSASKDYGRTFAEIFSAVEYDFYKIDPMLFSPARVAVTSLESGKTYRGGKLDPALLEQSYS